MSSNLQTEQYDTNRIAECEFYANSTVIITMRVNSFPLYYIFIAIMQRRHNFGGSLL